LRTLESFGLYWDETVLFQSQRNDAYQAAIEQLRQQQQVYPCHCSRKSIAEHARHGVAGSIYPDTCRELPSNNTAAHSLRMRTEEVEISFDDPLFGTLQQNIHRDIGDFVLRRADGLYSYQLAVVVDDAAQNISEVVRGYDLYPLTPAQIYLQQQLGYATPKHVHLPLLMTATGQKLSKQNGACAVDTDTPLPVLIQILNYLGQQPAAELLDASLDEFWQWAINNWTLENVPRQANLPI
jgi:glutamyl-Q tRNA(Asp) synthetase